MGGEDQEACACVPKNKMRNGTLTLIGINAINVTNGINRIKLTRDERALGKDRRKEPVDIRQ